MSTEAQLLPSITLSIISRLWLLLLLVLLVLLVLLLCCCWCWYRWCCWCCFCSCRVRSAGAPAYSQKTYTCSCSPRTTTQSLGVFSALGCSASALPIPNDKLMDIKCLDEIWNYSHSHPFRADT